MFGQHFYPQINCFIMIQLKILLVVESDRHFTLVLSKLTIIMLMNFLK